MQSAKEKASDAAAAAKAGMEKTKATVQEKGEKMTSRDPLRKDMASERKEQRMGEAELKKQAEYDKNAAEKQAKQAGTGTTGLGGTGGGGGYGTGI